MIIGITGKARSGKDTAANALKNALSFEILPFADPLKRACMFKFGLSEHDVFTQEGKDRFVPEWGMTVGEILQKEGTEGSKPFWGDDIWIKRWLMDVHAFQRRGLENIVAPDCRFDMEAEKIWEMGGKIIHITRPGAQDMIGGRDPNHASEKGIKEDLIDITLVNDKGVKDLTDQVLKVVRGWM